MAEFTNRNLTEMKLTRRWNAENLRSIYRQEPCVENFGEKLCVN